MDLGAKTALTALALLGTTRLAAADANDLVMSRLATKIVNNGTVVGAVGENLEFRALASQLGVVLAPHLLTPADTLGYSGFQVDVEASQTTIDSAQPYWRVLAGSPDPGGTGGVAHGDGFLRTVGVFARKGLWLPVPSFELGVGAINLLDSQTWAAQITGKLAIQEGYHDLALPSLAIRGAVSRMINQRELDLTVFSADAVVSKHFGIGGTWRLDPFVGYDLLLIVPRSEVIDATPDVDPLSAGNGMDSANNFAFKEQAAILRHRITAGLKMQYDVVQLTVEAQYALAGSSTDNRAGVTAACAANSMTADCNATDIASAQTTVSISAGLDF
ncbi:MAG: hypothetical protein ABIY55_35205 [Kofleriaceae bacterium]